MRSWYWNDQTIAKNICSVKNELVYRTDLTMYALNHSMWLYKDSQTLESQLDQQKQVELSIASSGDVIAMNFFKID